MGALIAASAQIAVERGEDAALDHARELLARLGDADLPDAEELALIQQLAAVFMDSSDNLVLRMIRRGVGAQISHLPGVPWQPDRSKVMALRSKLDRAIAARNGGEAHEAIHALWSDLRERMVRALARPTADLPR